jgi:hypothetical protein
MKALSLILCLLILSSCASTPQSHNIKTNGPGSLSSAVELTETPFYPQTQYQCGPAALATVLQSHGVDVSPEKLSSQVYIPERKGSLQIEMTAAARRHEMLPYELEPQLLDLLAEIDAGNPVLILQNLSFEWFPQWHYAVVIGYDIQRQEIILRSGTSRRWITTFEVFERTWERADFWALVIVPVGNIPETAEPLRYLKTAYAFEQTGHPELALKAYQSASKRWPELVITWMTLGNMAFNSGDWSEAIRAFNTASALEPESIVAWNNLAYALHASGCKIQAQMALQCGLKIKPADKNLQDSLRELMGSSVSGSADCPLIQCY